MNCVYFTYDGLLDPLGRSQIIPYVQRLVTAGHSFVIISYEKQQRSAAEILAMECSLNMARVEWLRLPFGTGKMGFLQNIIRGMLLVRKTCKRICPDIVHLRGFMPAVIYKLSRSRVPHLYDFRGFGVEEWMDSGKIRAGSLPCRVLRKIDHRAVETASGLVVLEKPAETLLRKTYNVPKVPLKVIRTCTDLSLYQPRSARRADPDRESLRFVCLGGARRPYRPDLSLRLVSQLLKSGVDCRLDFINERDHAEISAAIQEVGFPQEKAKILKMDYDDVPGALTHYDCGLIFLDTSPWRRVCSPTKLGEYLAAGLPVISIGGIDILDALAVRTPCVMMVNQGELSGAIGAETVNRIAAFIRRPGVGRACQGLAQREFGLDMAGRLYSALYDEVEANMKLDACLSLQASLDKNRKS